MRYFVNKTSIFSPPVVRLIQKQRLNKFSDCNLLSKNVEKWSSPYCILYTNVSLQSEIHSERNERFFILNISYWIEKFQVIIITFLLMGLFTFHVYAMLLFVQYKCFVCTVQCTWLMLCTLSGTCSSTCSVFKIVHA